MFLGKIERWGYCSDICSNEKRETFRTSNLNILDDDYCQTLLRGKQKKQSLELNHELEICTGKKIPFPKSLISFTRRKKRKTILKKQKDEAKTLKFPPHNRPTKYTYILNERKRKIPDNYPFNWILGGSDSCHGDLGGPLWRNIRKNKKV